MPHTHTTDETEKKKKKTHNPFKIIKNKIMGLGHKKHKKKSEKTTTHTAPSHLASHTIQRITPPPIKPTASMLMAEHPLEMEQIISSPLPLTTSQTSEKSSPHHPQTDIVSTQTKTVSSLSAPVLIPTLITASSLPDPEKASHTVTESEQATHIPPEKSNVSEWDFSALPEEEEALDQIPLQAHKLITKAEPSRASQINTALETYVPGWRLLMHSVFEPMVQHNIEASDAWVEKLAGFLPSASDTPSLLVPQPLGFLPYSISLVPEETQKIDESEDASMTHQTKAVLKR